MSGWYYFDLLWQNCKTRAHHQHPISFCMRNWYLIFSEWWWSFMTWRVSYFLSSHYLKVKLFFYLLNMIRIHHEQHESRTQWFDASINSLESEALSQADKSSQIQSHKGSRKGREIPDSMKWCKRRRKFVVSSSESDDREVTTTKSNLFHSKIWETRVKCSRNSLSHPCSSFILSSSSFSQII